jgi:hypothetical protein
VFACANKATRHANFYEGKQNAKKEKDIMLRGGPHEFELKFENLDFEFLFTLGSEPVVVPILIAYLGTKINVHISHNSYLKSNHYHSKCKHFCLLLLLLLCVCACLLLGREPRVLHMLSKHSTTELHLSLTSFFYILW